jgi:hypothetical protein
VGGFASVVIGVARLARGRADGLGCFGNTTAQFTASLAPFIALPLVGTVLLLIQGEGLPALVDLFATWAALLAPPVVSWELTRLWRCEARWLRYATAFNWCLWAMPLAAVAASLLLGVLVQIGVPLRVGATVLPALLLGYGLWLHWFIARVGLGVSRARAVVLVLLTNLATSVLALGPLAFAPG